MGLHEALTAVIVGDCGGGVLIVLLLVQPARRERRITLKTSHTDWQ